MTTSILLPTAERTVERYEFSHSSTPSAPIGASHKRSVYAAAHVVADPLGDRVGSTAVDWDGTLSYRYYLWSLGLGVAEAMDTSQRGSGLLPGDVRTLISRSIEAARSSRGDLVCGVGTDGLEGGGHSLAAIVAAYQDQLHFVQDLGGSAVIMASRALAATAQTSRDYEYVYDLLLADVEKPVILHWLGPQFDPALAGYWGSTDAHQAMETLLSIVASHRPRVDGVKISMLDADLEIEFRERLTSGVKCFTGDDFNYPMLIEGDGVNHSHVLLGIFDAIAPIGAAALQSLDVGDMDEYHRLLDPTVPLSRHIFEEPTSDYKTGLVFLAYLTGHQDHFRMLGGRESARSIVHLSETVRLADAAGLFIDSEEVVRRLRPILEAAGIG